MPTNKIIEVREPVEIMNDYTPVYQPIYALLMGNAQSYSEDIGSVEFKHVDAIGDIRGKRITPKDTEIRQVAVGTGKKTFSKYFFANQYTQSTLQSREGSEQVAAIVLDEYQKQADELLTMGDGTANGNILNNGLFFSNDSNYVLKTSTAALASNTAFYDAFAESVVSASEVPGEKIVFLYGGAKAASKKLFTGQAISLLQVLKDTYVGYTFVDLPNHMVPAGQSGWIIVSTSQVKLHYVALPKMDGQGVNEEKKYIWQNFLMGSMMLEVLAKGAVVRQPVTVS